MTADETVIELVHEDADLLVVNKPAGLAVHRSRMVARDEDYLIDRLRAQVDGPLHLVNRLDRATSGLVLVARNRDVASQLGEQLMQREVDKRYLAIVRGWPESANDQGEPAGTIDYPLTVGGMRGERKPASTNWRRLGTVEVPIALGRYPQQRYSLLELQPLTGRYRQLRRHLHHIHHPIIGDSTLGRGEHNRLFRQHFASHRMLLHAWRLRLVHPVAATALDLHAPLDTTWQRLLVRFDWADLLDPARGWPYETGCLAAGKAG